MLSPLMPITGDELKLNIVMEARCGRRLSTSLYKSRVLV